MVDTDRRIATAAHLTSSDIKLVSALIDTATENDGVRPVSEHALLRLRDGAGQPGRTDRHLLVRTAGGDLAGYAHLDPGTEVPVAELAVHPDLRGRGHGRALVAALLGAAPAGVRAWAHGDLPAARALAAATGFTRIRALWQLRRPLTGPEALPLPEPAVPAGVRVRAYDSARDAARWVELNRRAFVDHPEQGTWTLDDLRDRERQPWFDPAGFFLAERGGELVGFHWTKVHDTDRRPTGPDARGDDGAGPGGPIGEVYVVGVSPAERGTGLGRALTLTGLRHLRDRGLARAMLYVDESNTAAVRLYEALGFTRWSTDAMYERHPGPSGT